jgi:hypothetical protein
MLQPLGHNGNRVIANVNADPLLTKPLPRPRGAKQRGSPCGTRESEPCWIRTNDPLLKRRFSAIPPASTDVVVRAFLRAFRQSLVRGRPLSNARVRRFGYSLATSSLSRVIAITCAPPGGSLSRPALGPVRVLSVNWGRRQHSRTDEANRLCSVSSALLGCRCPLCARARDWLSLVPGGFFRVSRPAPEASAPQNYAGRIRNQRGGAG